MKFGRAHARITADVLPAFGPAIIAEARRSLAAEPAPEAHATLLNLKSHPEELLLHGRELYIYFPDGVGRSKLPWSSVEKLLKVTGTARNWNSVTKMLAIAEEMEAAD